MTEPEIDSKSRLALGAAVATMFLWTFGNVLVKWVHMPGVQIAFWRVVMAASVYSVALCMSGRRLTRRQLLIAAPSGVAISLEIAVFFVAIKSTTVANATVIGALQPLVLLVVASRRFGERVTRALVAMALVALVGVALVVFGSSFDASWSPKGDFLAFVAMLLFAAYFALAKDARSKLPAIEFQTGVWVVGVVALLPVSLIEARGVYVPSGWNWAWLSLLVLVPGTGHLLVNWAHSRVRLVISSMLVLSIPVLSTVAAAVVLGEKITIVQMSGMVVVLGALALVIKRETERVQAAHPNETSRSHPDGDQHRPSHRTPKIRSGRRT